MFVWNVINAIGNVIASIIAPNRDAARRKAKEVRGGYDAELQRPCVWRECVPTEREKHVLGDRER